MNSCAHASRLAGAFLLLIASFACSAPHRDYSLDQIRVVDNLAELMHVQATVADPCFALVEGLDDRQLTAAEWARLQDMGTRLIATAARVTEFSEKKKDFERWNSAVGDGAAKLVGHATNRDQASALAAVRSIQKSCRACHDEYK